MESGAFYNRESASDFFEQLSAVAAVTDSNRSACYLGLGKLFNRIINNASADAAVLLSGTFAKTDYLLRKHQADKALRLAVNDARIRFAKGGALGQDLMRRFFYYDLAAVAHLVALIFGCKIPQNLEKIFPEGRPHRSAGRLTHQYLRVLVSDFTDDCIFAYASSAPEQKLEIRYAAPAVDDSEMPDFSYLRPMLRRGSQLNLIRPRRDHAGVINPELIIYEPDLLTDVSAIASCFETYGTSPLISIIKRLMPAPSGDAINLGNFAGQLLDEVIQGRDGSYTDSACRFFRHNALSLAAVPPGAGFHNEARRQTANIRQAVLHDMKNEVAAFDRDKLMVEPTFFSEMLGLQGRMDFLQLDMKILAEQKSGKGEFPYGNFEIPRRRQPHYVQLLLYMAIIKYNFADIYKANGEELHAFLLYSKYSRSLLRLGFAPGLLRKAVEIRNGMVFNELRFADEGFAFLSELNPDSLNQQGVTPLWTRYTRPQLSAVLDPVKLASPLERAYFMRMMQFTAREHLLSKIGDPRADGSGLASAWHDTFEEKLESGNIYAGLNLDYGNLRTDCDSAGIESLRLTFNDDEACDMANFRRGDIVVLYPYAPTEIPDLRRNMVFRCTIEEIKDSEILLRLRAPQSGTAPFEASRGKPWAIEHDFIESSYSSLYRGLHCFLSATQSRRDLLMLRREPRTDSTIRRNGEYGPFNGLADKVAAARDIFLIIGPPGTGKTSYGMLYTVQEELTHPESNILVMAYTNRAVDEICSKLRGAGIEFIRLGNELSCADEFRPCLLRNKTSQCKNADALRQEIMHHRVFVATTNAINANNVLLRLKHFSLAIIDEASQILEPQLIGIMSANIDGRDAIDKFILIGDHKQLPAIVRQSPEESAVADESLRRIGLLDCRRSLFERLVTQYGANSDICHTLTRQGRMHHDIALFPSQSFYGGKLREVPLRHQTASLTQSAGHSLRDTIASHRILFFDVEPDKDESAAPDKVNRAEARLIARIIKEIETIEGENFDIADTVGVIVPYRNQIAAIRGELTAIGAVHTHDISIDTVERFQGSQRKYIIYGFTVRKYYQLQFLTSQTFEEDGAVIDRKLNVALTRAREHLIITGNAPLLRRNSVFSSLIDHIQSSHSTSLK